MFFVFDGINYFAGPVPIFTRILKTFFFVIFYVQSIKVSCVFFLETSMYDSAGFIFFLFFLCSYLKHNLFLISFEDHRMVKTLFLVFVFFSLQKDILESMMKHYGWCNGLLKINGFFFILNLKKIIKKITF